MTGARSSVVALIDSVSGELTPSILARDLVHEVFDLRGRCVSLAQVVSLSDKSKRTFGFIVASHFAASLHRITGRFAHEFGQTHSGFLSDLVSSFGWDCLGPELVHLASR
jgi:hypothetical protein